METLSFPDKILQSSQYDRYTSDRRRKNLQIIFNNTTIIPFKWRGRYLCFYCGRDYTDYPEFRKHTLSHGQCSITDYSLKLVKGNHIEVKLDISEISCVICSEPFESLSEVVSHLNGKHNLDYDSSIETLIEEYRLVDHRCLICQEQFAFFGYLVTHMNTTHPKNAYICDDCGVCYNKKRDLGVHIRNQHKIGGYPCDQCRETFTSLSLLRIHKNNHHLIKCKYCSQTFSSLALSRKHIKLEHPDDGSKKCVHCAKVCHSKLGLKQHLAKCKVKKITQDVNEAKSSVYQENTFKEPKIKRNIKQIRENIMCVLNMSTAVPFKFFTKYRCFYCDSTFVEMSKLKEHTTTEHTLCDLKCKSIKTCKGERICVKIDIAFLACKVCGKSMDELDTLIDHIIAEHKANYDKTVTGCLQPFKILKDNIACPLCPDQVFRYFSNLLKHMNTEHTNNNIICSFCGKSFRTLANLRAHLSYNHTRDTACTVCGVGFKNFSSLARHNAKFHDAKDFKCLQCGELFSSQYMRQKHLIDAHNTGHKCSYCGRMFTRNSFMVDHIRRTHYKEKNVPCSVCGEKFFDNYLLRMHMVKHDGERKFHCDVCGKSFLRRSNLSGHMDVHKKHSQAQGVDRAGCVDRTE